MTDNFFADRLDQSEQIHWPSIGDEATSEEIVRLANEPPTLRDSLRHQVVAASVAAYRRQRFFIQIQTAVACFLVFAAIVTVLGYALLRVDTENATTTVASDNGLSTESAPMTSLSALYADEVHPSDYVLGAMSQPDSWAVVEAFDTLRARKLQNLVSVIWKN